MLVIELGQIRLDYYPQLRRNINEQHEVKYWWAIHYKSDRAGCWVSSCVMQFLSLPRTS